MLFRESKLRNFLRFNNLKLICYQVLKTITISLSICKLTANNSKITFIVYATFTYGI